MNDQSLIHLLKADPEEGLRMAISLYGKAIKTICSSILRDAPDEDIEEAVSDTFVAIWQSARNFRTDQGVSFKSYCYGIARKKALTRRKTLLLDMNLIPLEENILFPQDTIADEHERHEEERILHEIIFALKEPQCSVFILRYFYFWRIREISIHLSLPEKKVENLLYRGKQLLKTALLERGITG